MTKTENCIRTDLSYKKTPTIQVLVVPYFISLATSLIQPVGSLLVTPVSPEYAVDSSPTTSLSHLGIPFNMFCNLGESSSQTRLIARQTEKRKLEIKLR